MPYFNKAIGFYHYKPTSKFQFANSTSFTVNCIQLYLKPDKFDKMVGFNNPYLHSKYYVQILSGLYD